MERNDEKINLKIKSVDGTLKLDWNEIENASRYELWCKNKESDYKMIFYGKVLSFIHYSAIPDERYSYYIRVVDAYCSFICESNKVEGIPSLARPRVSGKITRKGIVKLTWTPVVGATKYVIYRQDLDNNPKRIGQTKLECFLDDTCNIGIEYTYTIEAHATRGKSSLPSKGITLIGIYQATPFKIAISKNGFPLITWEKPEGAVSCHIYRTEDANIEPIEIACKIDSSYYINTTAKKGKTYFYSIRMEYPDGKLSLPSKLKEIRRPDHTEDYLKIVAEVNTDGNLRLSWNALEDAIKYQIYASYKYSSNSYEKIFETENTFYVNSAYKFDKIRYYRIRAIHSDGLKGKMSRILKIDPNEVMNK